jgi:hypothetical protein
MCVVIGKESSEFSRASKQLLTQMKVRVAIIQEAPIWMHLQASLKTCAIGEGGSEEGGATCSSR